MDETLSIRDARVLSEEERSRGGATDSLRDPGRDRGRGAAVLMDPERVREGRDGAETASASPRPLGATNDAARRSEARAFVANVGAMGIVRGALEVDPRALMGASVVEEVGGGDPCGCTSNVVDSPAVTFVGKLGKSEASSEAASNCNANWYAS